MSAPLPPRANMMHPASSDAMERKAELRARLLTIQFWTGVALAPIAALLLLAGGTTAAAVLAIIAVVVLAGRLRPT